MSQKILVHGGGAQEKLHEFKRPITDIWTAYSKHKVCWDVQDVRTKQSDDRILCVCDKIHQQVLTSRWAFKDHHI